MSSSLETIEAIIRGGGDPDDVLRSVVDALAAEPGVSWAAIVFLEENGSVLGPQAGAEVESTRIRVPVSYDGNPVAELLVDGEVDLKSLQRVADLISPHSLVGWDTGGAPWGDVA